MTSHKPHKRAKPAKPPPIVPDLPPTVPETRAEIDEARMILGHRTKGELRPALARRLADLIGAVPRDTATAANWKSGLLAVRDDEIHDD